jgi:hypothetical protein
MVDACAMHEHGSMPRCSDQTRRRWFASFSADGSLSLPIIEQQIDRGGVEQIVQTGREMSSSDGQRELYRVEIRLYVPVTMTGSGRLVILRSSLPSSTITNRSSSRIPGPGTACATPVQLSLT